MDSVRMVSKPECAGINRHIVGNERQCASTSRLTTNSRCPRGLARASPRGKENSESILASRLAWDIGGCELKLRQKYQWAGPLSFEKLMEQDTNSILAG